MNRAIGALHRIKVEERKRSVLVLDLVFVTLISLIFMMHNVINSGNILFYAGSALVALFIILAPADRGFLMLMTLLPQNYSIKAIGDKHAYWGLFLLLLEGKYFLIKFAKGERVELPLLVIAYAWFCLMSACINYESAEFLAIGRAIFMLVFASNYLREPGSRDHFKNIFLFYVWGCTVSVLTGFVYYAMTGQSVLNGAFGAVKQDRNGLGAVLVVGIAFALYCLLNSKKYRVFYALNMLVSIAGGLLTCSRTFVLSLGIIALGTLIFAFNRKTITFFLIFGIALGVVYCLFAEELGPTIDTIVERFSSDTVQDGNGRIPAWGFYLGKSIKSLRGIIFGSGAETLAVRAGEYHIVSHNTIVQAAYSYGYVSTIIYVLFMRRLYKNMARGKPRLVNFVPLMSCLFSYFTLSAYMSDTFNIAVILGLIAASDPLGKPAPVKIRQRDSLPVRRASL